WISVFAQRRRPQRGLTGRPGGEKLRHPPWPGSCASTRPVASGRCGGSGGRDGRGSHRRAWARRTWRRTSKVDRVIPGIRVVDPSHPLFAKSLRLLSERCGRGKRFVAVALEDGRRRLVLRSATDLDCGKQGIAPQSRISARSLLPLARHIRCYLAGVYGEEALNAGSSSAKASRKRSQSPSKQSTTPASAGSAVTGSPQPARSAGRPGPAAPSR